MVAMRLALLVLIVDHPEILKVSRIVRRHIGGHLWS